MLIRALLLLLLFIATPLRADEIRIAAAADLRFALDEVISTFKRQHPNERIEVSYGSSGKFHSQIQNGAPFDLFFSADIALPRSLAQAGQASGEDSSHHPDATVLFADIRHYPSWLAELSAAEMGLLLKRFYEHSGDTVHLFGASALQFVGEGVLAVFADTGDASTTAPHSLRATKAALGLRKAAAGMAGFVQRQFPGRALPAFEVGVALHRGPVAMTRMDGLLGGNPQLIPVGETVVDAMALQRHASVATGAITLSVPVLRSVTGAVRPVTRYLRSLPHRREPMDVCTVEPLPT